jgi:hypothetical protein
MPWAVEVISNPDELLAVNVAVELPKFVTPVSPPYSRAPYPKPDIWKSSWDAKGMADPGEELGVTS